MVRYLRRIDTLITRTVHLYYGFKFFLTLTMALSLLISLITAVSIGAAPTFDNLFTYDWIYYIFEYWTNHLWLIPIISILYISIFDFNALKGAYRTFVPPHPPHPRDKNLINNLQRLSGLCIVLVWALTFLVVPLLNLAVPRLTRVIAVSSPVLISLLPYWRWIALGSETNYISRLGIFNYQNTTSFNTASISSTAQQVKEELDYYANKADLSHRSREALEYIEDGDSDSLWEGVDSFFRKLSGLLGIEPRLISAHRSTTRAIRRSLEVSHDYASHIFTTDFEYHTVDNLIDGISESEGIPVHKVKIKDNYFEDIAYAGEVTNKIISEYGNMTSNIGSSSTVIVLLSHVIYKTGLTLPIQEIIEECRQIHNNAIFIIDGAQSIGNICVDNETIRSAEFYATSGHKWLMGELEMGILVHNRTKLREKEIPVSEVRDPSVPYSYIGYQDDEERSGESRDLKPMISLNTMLSEFSRIGMDSIQQHNKMLANQFIELVRSMEPRVVNIGSDGGIVFLSMREFSPTSVVNILENNGVTCEAYDEGIRISFHYFMSSRDVYELTRAIQDAINRPESRITHDPADIVSENNAILNEMKEEIVLKSNIQWLEDTQGPMA